MRKIVKDTDWDLFAMLYRVFVTSCICSCLWMVGSTFLAVYMRTKRVDWRFLTISESIILGVISGIALTALGYKISSVVKRKLKNLAI